jgi:ubiquinone/menaquinone biosynthesis C-methylase UbiE
MTAEELPAADLAVVHRDVTAARNVIETDRSGSMAWRCATEQRPRCAPSRRKPQGEGGRPTAAKISNRDTTNRHGFSKALTQRPCSHSCARNLISFQNLTNAMDEWIDYYDSTHTIYASKRHRDLHFEVVARDIGAYITSPDSVVLDYACGEALSAVLVADRCAMLILAEPAPGVRGRLIARFAPNTKIRVRSLDDVRKMPKGSVDLVVMNSVAQYMTPQELDAALAVIKRLLKPSGRFVLGDILRPEVGLPTDVYALLGFAAKYGFLKDALKGLVSTALSDYRQLRSRIGLQRYSEAEITAKLASAGFTATRAHQNIGHNPWRMTFVARPALAHVG